MKKQELEDIAAAVLIDSRSDGYVSQTVAQMYENAVVVIDTVIPLVTEAIASEFDAKAERLGVLAQKSGYALGANVERERLVAQDTARAIRKWRPTE